MTFLDSIKKKLKELDWLIILILLLAAFLRFFLLDLRPAHHDEGVFGWFVDQITANGFYRYDPTNYHGPLHYYILFLSQTLFGRSDWVLRLPDAIISLLTVYWIILFSNFLPKKTCLLAALALAVSPGLTYFGRYAFQEAFQVFYTILILWGLFGLYLEGAKKYLWTVGIAVTLMILTKETFVIHFGCFILAYFVLIFWEKRFPSEKINFAKQSWTSKDLLLVSLVGIGLIIFFYSGTFFNLQGITDLFKSFQAWSKTGLHTGHAKPFFYWLKLIFRYEYLTLIGMICTIRYIFTSNKFIRYTAIYGIGVFLAYSLIPYKTTWCIINILWPFYFVFAHFIESALNTTKTSKFIKVVCLVLFLASGYSAWKINFVNYENNKEPYVYVHTFNEIKKTTDPIFKLVKKDTSAYNVIGNVMRQDDWPLPWIFGDFTMIGYYGPSIRPQVFDVDFLVVESKRIFEVEQELKNKYFTETFTLRDAQEPSKVYFSYDRFKDIFPDKIPDFEPKPQGPIIPGQGLIAYFYGNAECNGNPLLKKTMKEINIYSDEKSTFIPPPFGVDLFGEINIPSSNITLILVSDDGGYIEIDGKRVIEDLGSHGMQAKEIVLQNMQGWRKIKIHYYDIWGWAVLQLKWKDLNGNEMLVPANALRFNIGDLNK